MKNRKSVKWITNLGVVCLLLGWVGCGSEPDTAMTAHERAHATGEPHEHGPDTHTHEPKTPGPNGGRLVLSVDPNFEFFVLDDRTVKLTFVDADAKPIDVTNASVSLTGGDRQNPVELSFAVQDNALVSNRALPDGDLIPVILTIQATPESDPVLERFNVDFATCSECQYTEYACICDH